MLFDDIYRTIEAPTTGLFTDRGSKFLAFAFPISADGEIKSIIAQLKSGHSKANHYCWALRLSPDRSVFRLNDDGEPSGTAGRPILNTLLSRDLTNIAVVVVRYFGGIMLGVPGLINAYRSAAEDALNKAVIVQKTVNDIYTIQFNYLQMNDVMRIIKDDDLAIIKQNFDNDCSIKVSIRKTRVNQTLGKFNNLTGVILKYEETK